MKEREAKFLVTSRSLPIDLGAVPEAFGFRVGPGLVLEHSDVYFDTADRRLDAGGEAMRIRTRGPTRLFAYKGATGGGAFMDREEIEEEMTGERSLAEWVEELARKGRLRVEFAPSELEQVLWVDNRRTVFALSRADGALIEVSHDDVRFRGPAGATRHEEMEVELKAGSEPLFEEFCAWFKSAFRLETSTESKYRRGLQSVYGVQRPRGIA